MKIEHSEVFKAIFARFVKRMRSENDLHPASVSARSVRNLRACKVRFDSCTKPMGRFILYLPAVISTLIEVMTTRAGSKSGHTATEHLQFIDSERVIAVSMLADAGDEALMLARFFDTGTHDPSETLSALTQFRLRIDFLFVQGNCFKVGFCKHALLLLEQKYSYLEKGVVKTLGGDVDDAMKKRCLGRMRIWAWLAISTIQTEFPTWDVTQCLTIFNLDDCDAYSKAGSMRDAHTRRLAHVLGLDEAMLAAEVEMVMPYASSVKSSGKGIGNVYAWCKAVADLALHRKSMKLYNKLSTLRAALVRALAWQGCTTSGVEQMFSRVDWGWQETQPLYRVLV
jgi:hypothetical protein